MNPPAPPRKDYHTQQYRWSSQQKRTNSNGNIYKIITRNLKRQLNINQLVEFTNYNPPIIHNYKAKTFSTTENRSEITLLKLSTCRRGSTTLSGNRKGVWVVRKKRVFRASRRGSKREGEEEEERGFVKKREFQKKGGEVEKIGNRGRRARRREEDWELEGHKKRQGFRFRDHNRGYLGQTKSGSPLLLFSQLLFCPNSNFSFQLVPPNPITPTLVQLQPQIYLFCKHYKITYINQII